MGLWGKITAPFKGKPSAPKPREYQGDPFITDPRFLERQGLSEEAYFGALMKYLEKEPGFSEETIQELYKIPAEQSKFAEQSALRRLSEGAAFRGADQSGGAQAGRGSILQTFGAGRAGMQRQTRVDAAKVALLDRYRQLQFAHQYTTSRGEMGQRETGMRSQYNMGLNKLEQDYYFSRLDQYNADYAEGMAFWSSLLSGSFAENTQGMGQGGQGGMGGDMFGGFGGGGGPPSETGGSMPPGGWM